MELESTMRSFKLHLAAELNLLMSAEHELTKQVRVNPIIQTILTYTCDN